MFSISMFKIFMLLSIFFHHVIADSSHHPSLQNRGDVLSSLDLNPDLGSSNSFEASPLRPTSGNDALLSEQASSPSLDNGDNSEPFIGAEGDECSPTAAQLPSKMRRAKRDKGICNADQNTKKSNPIAQPSQEQRGGQENNRRITPSSQNSPPPKPFPRPLENGGVDELCLARGFFYLVCAPTYLESRIVLINYNLDQCRPCMSTPQISFPIPQKTRSCLLRSLTCGIESWLFPFTNHFCGYSSRLRL